MPAQHKDTKEGRWHARSERLLLVLGFVLAAGALAFFVWLSEEMLEGETARFDSFVRSVVHAHATDPLTAVMKFVTLIGSSLVLVPVAVLALAFFYIRREIHVLKILAATILGAWALELILKLAFHRARPVPFFNLMAPASYSFPSGHAMVSFCVLFGVAMTISPRVSGATVKAAIWLVALLLVLGIGFSRIYLGVHYPSDVLAGYTAGTVWLAAVHTVDKIHGKHIAGERRAAQHADRKR